MDFSELREVELREAWPDEAADFTPWLEDNLQRLSRVIGMPLEPDHSQVSVDGFHGRRPGDISSKRQPGGD